MNRRRFLQLAGIAAFTAGSFPRFLFAESTRPPNKASPNFHPDVEIDLAAREGSMAILPGQETRIMKYHGSLVKGPEGAVKNIPGSYLGPVFNLRAGQKVRINFHNALAERSIVHWHGLHVPQNMDGHPMYDIVPGQTYVYEFEVRGRAGTFWYHSHAHERTGEQVYKGLTGLILVSDGEEQALRLPNGAHDIPLVIQDRSFDSQNQLRYLGSMPERMRGFLGDQILVNGRPDFMLPVLTRTYRLRLLNGSNSRIYKLAWSDGMPMTVIATDGGLLEEPVTRSYITLAPAERIELWVDFGKHKVGDELALRSLAFTGAVHVMGGEPQGMGMRGRHGDEGHGEHGGRGMMGGGGMGRDMMGGMMHQGRLPLGSEFTVLKVRVEQAVNDDHVLLRRLSTIPRYQIAEAENPNHPRVIKLRMEHMRWTLNGRTFLIEEAAPDEIIRLNTMQLIEFDNSHGDGHMMHLAHPMHFHEQPFQVVKREIDPDLKEQHKSLSGGFIDSGWKDTVLVMPGEKVTLLKRFDDFKGLYLYHCHNLEHEDQGMMRNFLVS
ncbi:multicopper oxidase family protein [Methylocaldum sp.]|uniref:multicopper oxidase family protein n=1 Tax=Methylocaldum sp. TaxID=1969727 RepID=UPI002D774A4F|nr:multicopper oxidase domain-containing protein [Methylocaldum sp.]